jgi:phage I-like protein
LPTEFRVFRAGVNETTEGPLVFDAEAAAAVMAAFRRRGVDIAIDLQHDSISQAARAARNDAADARGWCSLEVRDGELWAVAVRWTPDGERRLREGTQRYISPVAFFDRESYRVTEIFNLALVSQPATHDAQPLVAARRLERGGMDPKLIAEALDALTAGDAEKCAEILKAVIASAAGAPADAGAGDGASDGSGASTEATAEPPDPKKDDAEAMARALSSLLKVQGAAEVVAAVKALSADVAALKLSREADEHNERVALVGELVKLGAELPATAWADADKRVPVDVLRTMPMPALRARVEAFRKAPRAFAATPPAQGATGIAALSDEDRARAEQIKDPAARERFIVARLARMGGK